MDRSGELTAVGCNIFAGGFTLGVERHFHVRCHLEHDRYGVDTFRLNRPEVPVRYGPERWPADLLREQGVDLLYANPPCAVVSVCGRGCFNRDAGGKQAWRTDPRTQRFYDIRDLALKIKPTILAVESVVQLQRNAGELLEELAAPLRDEGYGVTHLLVNNQWHGVDQSRRRFYLLAHRRPLRLERLNWAPPRTAGEVLREVADPGYFNPPRPDHVKLWESTPVGRKPLDAWLLANPDPERWERGPSGVRGRPRITEYKLDPDKVMGVYYGDFMWHHDQPRRLGLNEVKALCGFPDEFKFHRAPAAFSEIARGVLPPMADWLARQLANSLRGAGGNLEVPVTDQTITVDLRRPPELEEAA